MRTKAIEGLDYKEIPLDIVKKLSAVLFNQFFITLQEDSLVFIGKESIEEFDDLFSTSYVVNNFWEQIYVGAKRTLFDSAIISKTREKNGISQKEMAEKIDVNLRTFQRIESGESTPDGLNLIKIMNYLGLDSYDLFVKKHKIYDDDFKKFRTNNNPSQFIENIE